MDIDKIYNSTKEILQKRFTNEIKRSIKKYNNRLAIACPFCGDSHKNLHAKRGTVYFDRGFYKCYNGDCNKSMSLLQFFKIFDKLNNFEVEDLNDLERKESTSVFSNSISTDGLYKICIPRNILKKKLKLKEFSELQKENLINFIESRKLKPFIQKFLFSEINNQVFVLNTTRDGERILSVQIRNFDEKKSKYKTLNWYSLMDECGFTDRITYESIIIDSINIESLKFGILDANLTDIVFVTEGPIDSFFLENSISTTGIHRMKELDLPKAYYIYDNDDVGTKEAEKMIIRGGMVFLWKKLLKDFKIDQNIKDINDLFKIRKFSKKELLCYFSNNPIDLMLI